MGIAGVCLDDGKCLLRGAVLKGIYALVFPLAGIFRANAFSVCATASADIDSDDFWESPLSRNARANCDKAARWASGDLLLGLMSMSRVFAGVSIPGKDQLAPPVPTSNVLVFTTSLWVWSMTVPGANSTG